MPIQKILEFHTNATLPCSQDVECERARDACLFLTRKLVRLRTTRVRVGLEELRATPALRDCSID